MTAIKPVARDLEIIQSTFNVGKKKYTIVANVLNKCIFYI